MAPPRGGGGRENSSELSPQPSKKAKGLAPSPSNNSHSRHTNLSPRRIDDSSRRPSKLAEHDEAVEPDVTSELRANQRKSKRIELSLTRPSYVLGIGSKKLRVEHRRRLEFLLRGLVRQQNWTEACGLLSLYLQATCKDRSLENNRFKYSVLMELLDHVDRDRVLNLMKLGNIYDVWMRRIVSDKSHSSEVLRVSSSGGARKFTMRKFTMRKFTMRDRIAVNLELVLVCLIRGEVEQARGVSISIKEQKEFATDPMANMVLGLVFYQLWYIGIPKDMQRVEMDQLVTPPPSLDENFGTLAGNTEDDAAYRGYDVSRNISSSSVMKDKRFSSDSHHSGSKEIAVKEEYLEDDQPQLNAPSEVFYANSTENEASLSNDAEQLCYASALSNLNGLDPWLLPIKLPQNIEDFGDLTQLQKQILNNQYKDALRYLRHAVKLSPFLSDALLTLIQLLLIGGQIDNALDVLEKMCENPDSPFPLRVQAALLEHFDRQNHAKIASCYESLLKIDPTCSCSISRLITMHHNGDYDVECLLEMIALHLDYADINTWGEFASCFLKLVHGEGDCESICMDREEDRTMHFRPITPQMFMKPNSAKTWKDRCRYWLINHFSSNMLDSEIESGNLQLASHKAACAAYLHGQGFDYVTKLHSALKERGDMDLLPSLRMHLQNSAKLYSIYPLIN